MSESLTGTSLDGREEQIFPRLMPTEIDRLRRFGKCRQFKAGDMLVRACRARLRYSNTTKPVVASTS